MAFSGTTSRGVMAPSARSQPQVEVKLSPSADLSLLWHDKILT